MTEIEWIYCPDCGKKLCRIKTELGEPKPTVLFLWCRDCKEEKAIKVGTFTICKIT